MSSFSMLETPLGVQRVNLRQDLSSFSYLSVLQILNFFKFLTADQRCSTCLVDNCVTSIVCLLQLTMSAFFRFLCFSFVVFVCFICFVILSVKWFNLVNKLTTGTRSFALVAIFKSICYLPGLLSVVESYFLVNNQTLFMILPSELDLPSELLGFGF